MVEIERQAEAPEEIGQEEIVIECTTSFAKVGTGTDIGRNNKEELAKENGYTQPANQFDGECTNSREYKECNDCEGCTKDGEAQEHVRESVDEQNITIFSSLLIRQIIVGLFNSTSLEYSKVAFVNARKGRVLFVSLVCLEFHTFRKLTTNTARTTARTDKAAKRIGFK